MTQMNVTGGMDATASVGPAMGWAITVGLFLATLLVIFLLSKNFRQFIYGAVISGVFILNFKLSRWVGVSATKNDFAPLKWSGYIIGFIVFSVVLGRLVQKLSFVKRWEKKFAEVEENE